jgi:hypothetical protein
MNGKGNPSSQTFELLTREPSPFAFPEFFVAIIVKANAGDAPLGISLEGNAARVAGGIKERG